MRLHRILSFVVAVIVLPAIAFAQKTTYDYDKTAVFAQFKTYSTKDGTSTGNPLVDKRIAAAIEAQLAAKGLVRNDATPDVFVLYHVAFDEAEGHLHLQQRPGVRRVRLGLGRRVGNHDHGRARAGNPRRHPRCRHRRRAEGRDCMAWSRHERDRHQREAREARYEHHQGGGENLQELSPEGEEMTCPGAGATAVVLAAAIGMAIVWAQAPAGNVHGNRVREEGNGAGFRSIQRHHYTLRIGSRTRCPDRGDT